MRFNVYIIDRKKVTYKELVEILDQLIINYITFYYVNKFGVHIFWINRRPPWYADKVEVKDGDLYVKGQLLPVLHLG